MLIASMVIFGTIGIFRRFIDIDSALLALLRGYIGVIVLFIIMAALGIKPGMAAIRKNLKWLLISGAMIGLNWMLLFEAYNYTTVAIATICYYMAPVFVMIASPFILKENLGLKKVLCGAVALLGVIMVSGVFGSSGGSVSIKGVLYGLGAAILYAAVIIVNQKIRDIGAYDKTIIQLGMAATVLLPYVILKLRMDEKGLFGGESLSTFTIIMILIVGIINTGVAYSLYFGSMGALPAQTVAVFGYIDPVVAIVLSGVLLKEKIGITEIVGAVLVLVGTIGSEI